MPAPRPRFVTSATIPWASAHSPRTVPTQNAVSPSRTQSRTGESTLQSKSVLIGAAAILLAAPSPIWYAAIATAIVGTTRATMPAHQRDDAERLALRRSRERTSVRGLRDGGR